MKATLKHLRPIGYVLLALAAASIAPSVHAQSTPSSTTPPPPPPGEGRPHMDPAKRLEKMKKDLGLSDDQVAKLKALFESQEAAAKAIRDNASLSEDEKREQLHAAREANTAKIKDILTPDQFEKFKAMHHRGPGGPGGPEGGAPSASTPSAK